MLQSLHPLPGCLPGGRQASSVARLCCGHQVKVNDVLVCMWQVQMISHDYPEEVVQVKKIAKDLGVTEAEVVSMNRRMANGGDTSLNVSLNEDGEGQAADEDRAGRGEIGHGLEPMRAASGLANGSTRRGNEPQAQPRART